MTASRTATYRWQRWAIPVWAGLTGAGLLLLIWLGQRPNAWPANPVGWWSGRRMQHRPLWPMRTKPEGPAHVTQVDGDPAFLVNHGGSVRLGRWIEGGSNWSWAFWIQLNPDNPDAHLPRLQLAEVDGPRCQVRLQYENGRLDFRLQDAPTGGEFSVRTRPVALNHWRHLALCRENSWLRLYVDGSLAGESFMPEPNSVLLGEFAFTVESGHVDPLAVTTSIDDAVIYDQCLTSAQVAALAGAKRGRFAFTMDRTAMAQRLESWFGLIAATGWAVLLLITAVAPLRNFLADALAALPNPDYRPVWLVLVLGALTTAGFSLSLARKSRAADQFRFDREVHAFKEATDSHFEAIAALLNQARDWISFQTNLTQAGWERWVSASHALHESVGLIGLGYAERVVPEELGAHVERWQRQHGLGYHLWPELSDAERWQPPRLLGHPRLPVVLYQPARLDVPYWRTNSTIFGRDLLAMRKGDPRVKPEPVRLEEVIGEGSMMSSGLEEIAPAAWYGRAVDGIRLYAPLVREETTDVRVPIDPTLWQGVVFASVDLRRWLDELKASPSSLGFRIFTGESGRARHNLAVDSGELMPDTAWRGDAKWTTELEIPLYHYRLWVDFWSTPVFDTQSQRRWAWFSAGAGSGFTLLTASLLFVQVRGREKLAASAVQLRAANEALAQLNQERARLSRDLHDGTIQNLYAVGLHLQHARRHLPETEEKTGQGLEEGQRLVQETIVELREFLLLLLDEPVANQSFEFTVAALFRRLRRTTAVEFELTVDPAATTLPSNRVVQLVNLVREAVSNALRHGNPIHVSVSLRWQHSTRNAAPGNIKAGSAPGDPTVGVTWQLDVLDDGIGFDSANVIDSGFGLRTMRERAAELGGTLTVRSAPNTGTLVAVRFTDPPQHPEGPA